MNGIAVDQWLDLRLTKKIFLGSCAGVLLIFSVELAFTVFRPALTGEGLGTFPVLQKPAFESFDFYATTFKAGGLFGRSPGESSLTVLKSSIGDLIKDYRLKGVVILSDPEAIIEDARTKKTTFLKTGQKLGDLTVKEIREGKVVLTYYGEESVLQIE